MKKHLMAGALALTLALTSVMGGSPFQVTNSENKVVAIASAAVKTYKKEVKVGRPLAITKFPGMAPGDSIRTAISHNDRVATTTGVIIKNGSVVLPLKEGITTIKCYSKQGKQANIKLTVKGTYRRAKSPFNAMYDVAHNINNGKIKCESSVFCRNCYNNTIELYMFGVSSATNKTEEVKFRVKFYDKNKKLVCAKARKIENDPGLSGYAKVKPGETRLGFIDAFSSKDLGISSAKFDSIRYIKYFKY